MAPRAQTRHPIRTPMAWAAGVMLAAALAVLPAGAASAHNYLVATSPAADSTVSKPLTSVELTFNDRVLDFADSTRLQVTGPDGRTTHLETACATVDDTEVSAPVALTEPGEYTVVWRIVSADGHAVSDEFSFRYEPDSIASASTDATTNATAAAAPDCGGSSEGTSDAATDPGTQSGSYSYVLIGTAIVVAIIAIVGFGVIILRRPRDEDDEQERAVDGGDDDSDGRAGPGTPPSGG